ncbi:MAG: C13 family peptidase [Pseudomonadota bacterium]
MRIIKAILGLAVLGLSACLDAPETTTNAAIPVPSAVAPPERTFLFSWGMYGDPVFDRDVITFNRAYGAAFGSPAGSAQYGVNAASLSDPDPAAISADLTRLATAAVDGEDLVVVMLTSHGVPDRIVVQPRQGGEIFDLTADDLANLLSPLSSDQQILILQACFSGSLIDELRSPNRIILTAASADRSSFGCSPESDNTWFIKALNRAMGEGGSWQQIFERTRALVAADEAAQGVPASNPQRFVGTNMREIWTRGAI